MNLRGVPFSLWVMDFCGQTELDQGICLPFPSCGFLEELELLELSQRPEEMDRSNDKLNTQGVH